MPATTAIGTARINGHGVATISTASARVGSPLSSQAPPAITSVTGMKIAAYRSASRTNGAFSRSASFTRRTIPAYVLSSAVVDGPQVEGGPGVDGARSHEFADRAFDRARLAGERRLVEHAVGPSITPSTGTTSPRLDQQPVARPRPRRSAW